MEDHITCDNNSLTFETILASLFDQDANGFYFLRCVEDEWYDSAKPITCSNKQDFLMLFRQAIAIADDGRPALRICTNNFADGAGLSSVHECGTYKSLNQILRSTFCETDHGFIALNLAIIT